MNFTVKTLVCLSLIVGVALPAIAALPNRKTLKYLGVNQPGDTQELYKYLDQKSPKKRGKFIFYTTWGFWKYKRLSIVATKSIEKADCQNWEITMSSFQGFDAKGNPIGEPHKDSTKLDTSPDTLGDKTLQIICK
jgi:hypothetical protein